MTGFHEGAFVSFGADSKGILESQKGTVHFGKGLAKTLVPITIYCACAELCDQVGSCENDQKYANGEQVSLEELMPLEGVERGTILPAQLKLGSSLEPDKKPFHAGQNYLCVPATSVH